MLLGNSLAYAQLKVYYQAKGDDGGCRLPASALSPIISHDNPFFYGHRWEPAAKAESAMMSANRQVYINQKACLRHHIEIEYVMQELQSPPPRSKRIYATEIFNLMNRLFYNDLTYYSLKEDFEQQFLEHFAKNKPGQPFNFIHADYTFIFLLEEKPTYAQLNVEIVRFLHTQQIKEPGIKAYLDDGHFASPKLTERR